jgi:hypothetical protein
MVRPAKLTPNITQRIGDGVALGLSYALAAASAGITSQTFGDWMKKGKNSSFGDYFQFAQHIKQYNANGSKVFSAP